VPFAAAAFGAGRPHEEERKNPQEDGNRRESNYPPLPHGSPPFRLRSAGSIDAVRRTQKSFLIQT
jgi:hypothetical protein